MVDQYFYSKLFVGLLIRDGKKVRAEKVFAYVLEGLKKELGVDPFTVIEEAVRRVKPTVNLKPHVASGLTYRVPVLVPVGKEFSLAVKWIMVAASERKEHSLVDRICGEIIDINQNIGLTVKRKEEVHRTALTNRPFLKFLKKIENV